MVAVGFTYDPQSRIARVITSDGSVKVRNAERLAPDGARARAAVCQVDGRRWLTLEGARRGQSRSATRSPTPSSDTALRYRTPRINPRRVVLTIAVDRMLGHA